MNILAIIIWLIYGLCLAFIFCYSLVQLQLTWLYLRAKKKQKQTSPTPEIWPAVTVQLPIYNEVHVVERLLDAIMTLDYPPEKLQVQVLDDSTDNTSKLAAVKVAYYRNAGRNIALIHRPDRTGYKAGALQYALPAATGEFIAIFDADFLPDTDFLKKCIPAFDAPDIGVVQTRWAHLNQDYSVLTQLQAFGLDAHFTIEQTGRNAGGHFINFNGTAGVWRKSCITDAGGWQADTLTEDLDLSYRAQLRNWKFKYLERTEAPAELPATMTALKSQQFRWTKGAAENVRKNLGPVLRSPKPWDTKLNAVFHLLNSSVFICVLILAVLSIPVLLLSQQHIIPKNFLSSRVLFLISLIALISFYLTAFCAVTGVGWRSLLLFVPRFFLFLSMTMGLSLHNSIAVAEGYLGIKTPFVRTPKFNIRSRRDTWQNSLYAVKNITILSFLEGLLCLYFLAGVYLAFRLQDFGMLPFHVMLSLGFGAVFYLSVKHSQ